MTLESKLTTTVAALALAFPAYAGTETDVTVDTETGAEVTANDTDATIGIEGEADVTAEAGTETEMEGEVELAGDAEAEGMLSLQGLTVAEVVGMSVRSEADEDVGEIDYVFMDGDEYKAVIGIGGFLGLGEYTVALPLSEFEMRDGYLVVNQRTEAELESMPEIDESEIEALDGEHVIS